MTLLCLIKLSIEQEINLVAFMVLIMRIEVKIS